jgi:HlyD family secretion protein
MSSIFAAFVAITTSISFAAIDPAVKKSTEKKASVVVTKTKMEKFSDIVQYPARVRSKINAWVVSESIGEVRKILKPIGSAVKRGETVLIVQNTDPVYRYAPVKILSPADGYVTSLEVDLLNRVDRGQRLFSVTDPKDLIVETEIPSADLKYFRIGQTATLKDQSGVDYSLVVKALSPMVDIRFGTASAELKPVGKGIESLKQGQIGQISFDVHQRSCIVLPASALIYREGLSYVRVLENMKVKKIPVKIAVNLGDKIEIAEGLKEGQTVITRWSRFIADNEEVEIQPTDKTN